MATNRVGWGVGTIAGFLGQEGGFGDVWDDRRIFWGKRAGFGTFGTIAEFLAQEGGFRLVWDDR